MTADPNEIFNRYKPNFDYLRARCYAWQPFEDTLLLRWWLDLNESGDIVRLITPASRRLTNFISLFNPPTVLVYALSLDSEIDNAAWLTPVDLATKRLSAYFGLYCSPSCRGTMRQLHFTNFIYHLAFEFYSDILGMTWQPELLKEHIKLGYNTVGCIPNIYDQPHVYIVHLTREAFTSSRFYKTAQRRK